MKQRNEKSLGGQRHKAAALFFVPRRCSMKHYKPSDPFYHSDAWKKARKAALVRDGGMCQDCMARFRAGYGKKPRRADMVHHILSRETRPDLELCLSG